MKLFSNIKNIEDILFFILFLAFFLITLVTLFYSNKKKGKALKELSNYFNGAICKFSFTPSFIGEYQGLRFSILLIPAGKNSPAYLKISLTKNSSFKLSVYKESILSNLGKKIGVVHEVKINDEMFDSEFLIFSSRPNQAINYLNNTNIKYAIIALFSLGFNSLLIDGKKILIQKPNYVLEKDLAPQNITEILQKLTLLVTGL